MWLPLAVLFSVMGSETRPSSSDIPPGPPGVAAAAEIGGEGIVLSGAPAAGAPVIAMMSETAGTDETLVATGKGLNGVTLQYVLDCGSSIITSSPSQFLLSSADNRLAAVLPSNSALNGTTLVFAEKQGVFSRPFRINGPEIFWISPVSVPRIGGVTAGTVLSVYGKNLQVSGTTNRLYLSGPNNAGFKAHFTESHENLIRYALPTNLAAGTYTVWAHNGTGKSHGWSEPVTFSVYDSGSSTATQQVAAPVSSPSQNWQNIQAKLNLGGTVLLTSGVYVIDQPLVLSNHYTTLKGLSYGSGVGYDAQTVSGTPTVIRYDLTNCLDEVIRVTGENTEIRNMILINGHDGGRDQHQLIEVQGKSCTMQSLRLVMYDNRNWGTGGPPRTWNPVMTDPNPSATGASDSIIDDGCIFFNYGGDARGLVQSCYFYTISTGIRIGTLQNSDLKQNAIDPAVRQVAVKNCSFYGEYAGEANRQESSTGSGRATGIVIYNGKEIEVSDCVFASAGRAHRRLLNRSVLTFNSSTRDLYLAKNTTLDCGTAGWGSVPDNQGEQYLFHYRYTKGGLFDAISATNNTLVIDTIVDPADSGYEDRWYGYDQRGGWVPNEVGSNDHWYAFIVNGTGVGQYRPIMNMVKSGTNATLTLGSEWRLPPDSSSRICLFVPMHHLIVYSNFVDCGNVGGTKTHVASLWNDCVDNVIRNNEGRNLSAGVTVNGCLWAPSAWNLIEGNTFSNMYLYSARAQTAVTNAFIAFQFATTRESAPGDTIWPTAGWYGVGNIARYNSGTNAGCGGVMANAYFGDTVGHTDVYDSNESLIGKGMQLCGFEKNSFAGIETGVFADCNLQSGMIRQNRFGGILTNRFMGYRPGHEPPKTQILQMENTN
jgi:hypothetical protein